MTPRVSAVRFESIRRSRATISSRTSRWSGRARIDLFRNYIGAVERHEIVCPRIDALYTEHKYCGEDDLYGPGHPPDTVVALLGAV